MKPAFIIEPLLKVSFPNWKMKKKSSRAEGEARTEFRQWLSIMVMD